MKRIAFVATLLVLAVPTLRAQERVEPDVSSPTIHAGWVFTPSFVYSLGWDDNVLVMGNGDNQIGDALNVVNPRGTLNFLGKTGDFNVAYDGAFLLYRELGTLDSYDQHASLSGRRYLSPHVSLFVRNSLALTPTTAVAELVGVPFLRTGSEIDDGHAGIEAKLSRQMSIVASLDLQWVRFDNNEFASQLQGGRSVGGTFSFRDALTQRTSIVADYNLQHATVAGGREVFDVQNGAVGVEQRLSAQLRVYGLAGIARVGVSTFGPARTGPALRAGLTRDFQTAGVDVLYNRSFVPSYGFGGTMQNEDLTGRLRLPLTRRLYTQSSISFRTDQPLTTGELNLNSRWIEATLGYMCRPWLHIEGFFANTHQDIDRPGGTMDRNRVGIQIVTTSPMRVR